MPIVTDRGDGNGGGWQSFLLGVAIVCVSGEPALANPVGPTVVHGAVSISQPDPATLQITNSPNAIIDWQSFSIAPNEVTRFVQQSPNSAVLNRVVGSQLSDLLGQLQSNGRVYLLNPNGIVIGADAVIDTAGFLASTLNQTNQDFLEGKLRFEGSEASGAIRNHGLIKAGAGGNILLLAPDIENGGVITSDGGTLVLAAGKKITLASIDGGELYFEVQAPDDSVVNLGKLLTAGGAIEVFAGTLRQAGEVRASTLSIDATGTVVLSAAADTVLEAGSATSADGATGGGEVTVTGNRVAVLPGASISADAIDSGSGGRVVIIGDDMAAVHGNVSARGGAAGGDGGFVETSGRETLAITTTPDVTARAGASGSWLIDPNNITITATPGQTDNINGISPFLSTGDGAQVGINLIEAALAGGASVTVTTGTGGTNSEAGDIRLQATLDINGTGSSSLSLIAAHDIIFDGDDGAAITDSDSGSDGLNLILNAAGTIYFDNVSLNVGSGSIDARRVGAGALKLTCSNIIGVDLQAKAVTVAGGTHDFSGNTLFESLTQSGGTLQGGGVLTISNSYAWTNGTLALVSGLAGGGTLSLSGTPTLNTTLTNSGRINVTTGAIAGTGSINNLRDRIIDLQDDATFASTLSIVNEGVVQKSGGTTSTLPAFNNAVEGVVNVSSGTLVLGGDGTHGGIFSVGANTALTIGASGRTNTFANGASVSSAATGTITFADGANTFASRSVFSAVGTTNVSGGATTFANAPSFATLNIGGGSVVFDGVGTAAILNLTGGTLAGSGELALTGASTWSGAGTQSGNGTTRVTSTGSLTISGTNDLTLDTRTLRNQNDINLSFGSGDTLLLTNGAGLINEASADFNVTAAATISGGASAQVTNKGRMTASANLALDADFVNQAYATFDIAGGTTTLTLAAARANGNQGLIDIASGATFAIDAASTLAFTNTVGAVLAGNGSIDLLNSASLVNAGRIEPGSSPGLLTFNGDLTLASTSVIELDLGNPSGTLYDRIAVNGDVTLGGTVETHLYGGYIPSISDTYPFLTFTGTRTGTFTAEPTAPLGITFNALSYGSSPLTLNLATVSGSIKSWTATSCSPCYWDTGSNWSGGTAPTAGSIVHVNQEGDLTITVRTTLPEIANLDSQETVRLTTSGVLNVSGDGTIEHLTIDSNGTLTGTGTVTVTDTLTWTDGTQSGLGRTVVASGADLVISG
ncbi:MAG: filamentous hemagglutinin N-terminal domain-containing protein, partial [Gammaproteobacteria bacterium]|nr:filamentous hemagglutinin N-terminal domain-containing protein [Gammaproteobacteria bacterium]